MDEKSRELTKKFKSLGVKIVETGNVSENSGGVNNSGIIVGDVHIGVTAEELVNLLTKQREAYVAELEKYTTDKKVIAKSIEELIDDRLVTKVTKRIFESYNDHYKKNLSDSDFKISIKELAEQSGDIAKDIKDLFKNVQRNGNVIDEIKERLETNQEELNFQIKGLCSICEEMRYYVQQLKQCENNGIKLDNVKLLITKYMEAAELRDKQLLSAIQQVSNNQAEFFSRLDINTMAEMFDVVKDISEQVKNGKQVSDIVSEYTLKLDVRIEKLEKLIKCTKISNDNAFDTLAAVNAMRGTDTLASNNNTGSKSPRKFSDFLPLLISIVVLIVGIILGFKQNQDLLYFILGGVEGIVSTGMSIVFIKQRVNSRKGNPHNKGIIASSCVIGLISLLFAIFLWLCSYMAIIERFTQWSKFAYLWAGLSCMILVSICAVIIICYLCPDSKKNKDDKESDV